MQVKEVLDDTLRHPDVGLHALGHLHPKPAHPTLLLWGAAPSDFLQQDKFVNLISWHPDRKRSN